MADSTSLKLLFYQPSLGFLKISQVISLVIPLWAGFIVVMVLLG